MRVRRTPRVCVCMCERVESTVVVEVWQPASSSRQQKRNTNSNSSVEELGGKRRTLKRGVLLFFFFSGDGAQFSCCDNFGIKNRKTTTASWCYNCSETTEETSQQLSLLNHSYTTNQKWFAVSVWLFIWIFFIIMCIKINRENCAPSVCVRVWEVSYAVLLFVVENIILMVPHFILWWWCVCGFHKRRTKTKPNNNNNGNHNYSFPINLLGQF